MRHKILTLLATSISLLGMTQTAVASVMQNGFYIGADVGAANLMDKESHAVNPESHQLGSIDIIGGGFIGYDHCLNSLVRMAIEGYADATSMQTSIQHAGNTYKMNQYYNLGIRLLPEYVFTPNTMGHFIVGYANGRFRINDNGVYGLVNSTYNRSGVQLGAGLATEVKNNLFIRIDALYNAYGSSTKQGAGIANVSATQSYTNRFSQLAGELSLYYKFI